MKKLLSLLILSLVLFFSWKISNKNRNDNKTLTPEHVSFSPAKKPDNLKPYFRSNELQKVQNLNAQHQVPTQSEHEKNIDSIDDERNEEKFHDAIRIYSTDKKAAIALLNEIIEDNPFDVLARERLADSMLGENRFEEAREQAIHCLVEDETNSSCHRTLVSTYTRQGQFSEAFPYLSDCLAIIPDQADCLSAMTNYHLTDNNLEEAEINLAQLEEAHPDSIWTALSKQVFTIGKA